MADLRVLGQLLETISGAVDDAMAGRPAEDVLGEIGALVDRALEVLRQSEATS
jgi:hypothetical protein